MDNFENEAVSNIPEAECGNKNLNKEQIGDPFLDTSPGTSKFCSCCSSGKLQDLCYTAGTDRTDVASLHSVESYVCRICQNCEHPEKLVSPCLCKGSLTYVHIDCLQRWISMSRCTTCELCQFQYNTKQTLRYTFYQSLRMWYSRSMSRRALQEDCQMFSLLTLVAFGIIGTLLVAVQYYILQGHISGIGRLWTKGWLVFFLFTTLVVYLINVYMIVKSQLMPWYRWWQSARDIQLILENHKPAYDPFEKVTTNKYQNSDMATQQSISRTTQICSHQQNRQMVFENNELPEVKKCMDPNVDATDQNTTKSLANSKIVVCEKIQQPFD